MRASTPPMRNGFARTYPASAAVFDGMAAEENEHRRRLIEAYQRRFGQVIPLIRREHVAGFYSRRPIWLVENLGLDRIRQEAARMEDEAAEFYTRAAQASTDPQTRKLLGDLAAAERKHEAKAEALEAGHLTPSVKSEEDSRARRQFVLTWVQPGLAGLMDGSVSTLAPIFATAFATQQPWTTFLVGLAASVGAGISMGFTEAAHDDGVISGRGSPVKRGLASGADDDGRRPGSRAALSHPGLLDRHDDRRNRGVHRIVGDRLDPEPLDGNAVLRAAFQVVLGGSLVLAAGILIGGS